MLPTSTVIIILVALAGPLALFIRYGIDWKEYPGPRGLPLIGNLHQIPTINLSSRLTEWSRVHGGLFIIRLGQTPAAVVTDRRIARELFDTNSAITSTRPANTATDFVTGGSHLLMARYGRLWREQRSILHQNLSGSMCDKEHMHLVEAESAQLLQDLLQDPGAFSIHIKRYVASIITSLTLGIRTPSHRSDHFTQLEQIIPEWLHLLRVGGVLSEDILPLVRYVPNFCMRPLFSQLRRMRERMHRLYGTMLAQARARYNEGRRTQSIVKAILDHPDKTNLTEQELETLIGVTLEGGYDTTSIMLCVFIQAMALHPEHQERAQAELDTVCGVSRSPQWSDRCRLPYINLILKEVMRWRPVAPLSPPRVLTKQIDVEGVRLYPGTILFLNIWGLHHDPSFVARPEFFDPTRYDGNTKLAADCANTSDVADRDHYAYGIGRRICPGIHLADRTLFITMAKMLWAFRFELQRDEQGNPIPIGTDPHEDYTGDKVQVSPNPFVCRIMPRSRNHEGIIMREVSRAAEVFASY
ncbi:cytochrome P450 [Aspergillus foveolatus]|uniref:cytochrome P450 n=1 Tax=Aspergillus foveolatus TaxID=210207 RepID=UPI003CCDB676